jgi:DNA-binding NarL/FixJ family response regulator
MQARSTRVPAVIRLSLMVENRLLRETLGTIFRKQPGITIALAMQYSETASEQVRDTDFEVLLIDQASSTLLPGNFVQDLLARAPHRKIVFFGMKEDSDAFLQAIQAGVTGYLLGDASAEDAIAAVKQVAAGEAVCPPRLCFALFQYVARSAREGPMTLNRQLCANLGLTARQQQLAGLLARGFSNKEIAATLNLSQFTVKNHIHRIMRQLKADSRYDAAQRVCEIRVRSAA